MPSVVHRLGELEHIYDKHNLKLRTTGSITLSFSSSSSSFLSSSSSSDDYAFPSNVQNLDALISSGTWTVGVNRLCLHIELLFDDISISGSSVSQATADIGIVLCYAELWSQLSLDASLTIDDSNKFRIFLSTQSTSGADIRPARSITPVCIEDISLSFHFSTCRRTRNALKAPVAASTGGLQHTLTSTNATNEHVDRRYHSPLSLLEGYQDIGMDSCTRWTVPTSLADISPVSSQGSVLSSAHSTSSLDSPTTGQRYATQEVKLEILVQMVDSSLRRMMSDNKPVRMGGIVLSSDAGCPKFAAISPALFSPGYVKAVSQRTALLPTIARTISRVYRRTESSRLKHKLKRLQDESMSNHLDDESTPDSDSSSVMFTSAIEARLWYLTRSKLIDPLACRVLKSLSTSNNTVFGSHEMLDESLDGVGGVMRDEDTFDPYGEVDSAFHIDLFQEHSLNTNAAEKHDPWDNDLFREHYQEKDHRRQEEESQR